MPRAQGVLCEALTPPRTEAERLAQQQELAEAQTERDEYNSTLNATNEERAQNGQPPLPSLPEQVIAAPEVQMVFINDMPHSVQYRSLGLELLQCAWDAGFRHLAVEALEESSEQFASRGFVSRTQSGPFLREPRMARLVKEAQALGFAIVGFPAESPCAPANTDGQDRQLCTYSEMAQSARSREQAESLLSQTLGADSEAKVLVWTLPRQAYKGDWDVNGSSRSLAGHVNAIVNPAVFETVGEVEQVGIYSVEQVRIGQANEVGDYGSTNESRAATWPNYDECRYSHYTLTEPRAPTEVSLALYDALVIHQRPEDIREGARWSWTYAPDDERAVVNVNCDSAACSPGDQVLVQAFQADIADVSDRVPADQALCTIAEDCEFVLPSGSYQVRVWAETGAEPIGMVETVDFSAQSVSEIRID